MLQALLTPQILWPQVGYPATQLEWTIKRGLSVLVKKANIAREQQNVGVSPLT